MEPGKFVLERAFEMASSGRVKTIIELQRALQHEGYNGYFIRGQTLLRQLRGLIASAGK